MNNISRSLRFALLTAFVLGTVCENSAAQSLSESLMLSDQVIPIQTSDIPDRPAPILELGDPFLGAGPISHGFTLPTGAVWQPSLMVWGVYRTALQSFDDGVNRTSEWANRFDLFSNLYLSQSERILVGLRPMDRGGKFTTYTFDSPVEEDEEKFREEFNAKVTTLFFEGDFGELFPVLDPKDKHSLDLGLAVGRQPLSFQEGMLINDSVDSLGISMINLKTPGVVNHRVAAIWGWEELNRNNLAEDDESAALFGVFNEIDIPSSTIEIDLALVDSETTGDGLHGGIGAIQRIGHYNTTFRALASHANGAETDASKDGELLFAELSRTITGSQDFVYLNSFWAIDKFRSASRASNAGGPLAATGVLFEAVGLGSFKAPLDSSANDSFGGALGYQLFSNDTRWQLLFELGGRYTTEDTGQRAGAGGLSLQRALGRRSVVRLDLFGLYGEARKEPQSTLDPEFGFGGRLEYSLRL